VADSTDPAHSPSAVPDAPVPGAPVPEARQRWRLVLRREPEAPPLEQRDLGAAFDAALAASGLPLVPSGRARSRIVFAAPLQSGTLAERELADLVLAERLPAHVVRDRLAPVLPPGFRLVELHDEWLGAPSVVSQVVAADYRVTVEPAVPGPELRVAAARLLSAEHLPRERRKGGGVVRYDLRPLLADLAVIDSPHEPDSARALRIRTRFHPELGTGRPEEVVAALGDQLGCALTPVAVVRERVLLAGED
jgi:radical SAM-linked protein